MKLLLVNPTFHSAFDFGDCYGEPLGLAYVAGAVEANSTHTVQVIDSVGLADRFPREGGLMRIGLPEGEVVKMVAQADADVIGIPLIWTVYADEICGFIKKIKIAKPETPILVGGTHATFEWRETMKNAPVDYVILGEAEETVVELLNVISEKKNISTVKGIAYRPDAAGEPVATERRAPVAIERIPLPAWHHLPAQNYFRHKPSHYLMRRPAAPIVTSRGCPFHCIFCSATLFWERKYRAHTPERVVDEMELLVKQYGVREFSIHDDCFLANRKRVEAICDEILKRRLDIVYQIPPGVNLSCLDVDLLKKLRQSGLYIIRPQFETGSVRTSHYIRKPLDPEKGRAVISAANRLGLWTQTNVILGFPSETREDIEESIRYIESVGFDNVNYGLPMPLRGTDLRKDYLDHKLIGPEAPMREPADSLYLTAVELEKIRKRAEGRYPWIRLRQILNPIYFFREFLPKFYAWESLMFLLRRLALSVYKTVAKS
jgi:radical SAM superfamily enzyme YgiQ (UPF0313 family)